MVLDVWTDARWWAGLSIRDRLPAAGGVDDSAGRHRGELRARLWQEGRMASGISGSLLSLCAREGIAEHDLVAVLGESPERMQCRIPTVPGWLDVLAAAWKLPARPDDAPGAACYCRGLRWRGDPRRGTDEALLRWVEPLVRWAQQTLRERIATRLGVDESARLVFPAHPLFAPDETRLLTMTKRVLVLELNIARERGLLCGPTPQERFGCFTRALDHPPTGLRLLSGYPVLARELVAHLRDWMDARLEFAERLAGDFPLLRDRFGVSGTGLESVTAVRFGVGDPHRRGRSVAVVSIGDATVVYKPRNVSPDRHFAALVRWLNGGGLTHPLRAADILDRKSYGWSAFVAPQACTDEAQLSRFYWRQGAYLAVFYALRAYDMHMQNVIAAGEHPVFIDLEAMFHSPAQFEEQGGTTGRILRESILAILLLPQQRVIVDGSGARAVEISGLAGGQG